MDGDFVGYFGVFNLYVGGICVLQTQANEKQRK